VFRTPYQFGGGYVDESRDIVSVGARWYDQNRELFYAPDPILTDDPSAILGKPALTAAYGFAGSNPLANVDPSGLEFFTSQARGGVKTKYADVRAFVGRNPAVAASIVAGLDTRLPRGLIRAGLNIKRADRVQAFADLLEGKPIVEIDPNEGTVKLSLLYGKRLKIPRNKKAAADQNAQAPAGANTQDATGNGVSPAVGPGSSGSPGSTSTQAATPSPAAKNDQGTSPAGGPSQSSTAATPQPRPRAKSAPPALRGGGTARADE